MSDFKIMRSKNTRTPRKTYTIDVAGVKRRDVGDFLNTLTDFRRLHLLPSGRTPFVQWEELAGDRYNVSGRFVVLDDNIRSDLQAEVAEWWPEFDAEASKQANDNKEWPTHWIEI